MDTNTTYRRLIAAFDRLGPEAPAEERWNWLMAAHIAGQMRIGSHLHSHWRMLRLALQLRDWREAGGQVFRLALVPLGHALRRLPEGNTGRANVSAFAPMGPDAQLRALIAQARG